MNCATHPQEPVHFNCHGCQKALCGKCEPVSYQGEVFCHPCLERQEQLAFRKETRRTSIFNVPNLRRFFLLMGLVGFLFGILYVFLFKPREVTLSEEDQERVAFYLAKGYAAGKGTPIYERQMDNIVRIDIGYRHILTFLRRGEGAFLNKNFPGAIQNFKSVQKMLPNWGEINIFLAEVYLTWNDTKEAERELNQSIDVNPNQVKAYKMLAEIYRLQNRLDQAILNYSKALFNDRENIEILLIMAELYIDKKIFHRAEVFRNRAKELGADTTKIDQRLAKSSFE